MGIQSFAEIARQQEGATALLADTPTHNLPAVLMFKKAGLRYKTDHVYLTCHISSQTEDDDSSTRRVHDDGKVRFTYAVNEKRITIRNGGCDDLNGIYTVGNQIFTAKSVNLYNFWDEDTVLEFYQSDSEFCLVATHRDEEQDVEKVIGFALGTTIQKPHSSWRYGYLCWIGSAPDYQGIGVASQLYEVMVELFAREKV